MRTALFVPWTSDEFYMSEESTQPSVSFFSYLLIRVLPITAVIFIVAALVGLAITHELASGKANESLLRQNRQTETIIAFRFENLLTQTKFLAKNALLINGLIDVEGRKEYLPPFFRELHLSGAPDAKVEMTDYKGRVLFGNSMKSDVSVIAEEWREAVIEKGESWFRLTGAGLIIVEPLLYSGNAEGAIIVTLGENGLTELFDVGVQYNETLVIDGSDRVVYTSNTAFGILGSNYDKAGRGDWRVISAPLSRNPEMRILTLQWERVALATQQWIKNFLIVGIILALIVLVGAIALTAYIVKRDVFRLSRIVRRITGTQDMSERVTPSGPSELFELGDDFNTMLDALIRTTASYEYVDGIISNTAEGIITVDFKGHTETFNLAAEKMFRYTAGEVLGKDISVLLPNNEGDSLQIFVLRNSDEEGNIGELEGRRSDGSIFPIELNVAEMRAEGETKFIGIFRDITERQQAERLKAEFVATVSHELRTPLTSIKGALGLIRSGVTGDIPEQQKSMLEIAYNNSDRLVSLINDLLDMEKFEAGKMEYYMKPTDLRALVDEAIEANKGYATEHGVLFVNRSEAEQFLVQADKSRLMQVLANLMSNAAKFSPHGDVIEMKVSRNSGRIRIVVKDHGPGIPEEYRATIFEKFSQADASDTRQTGGTGLGLSIARAIVAHHGGELQFDTEMGKGTTFYFEIPELVDRSEIAANDTKDRKQCRVLICEDDEDVAVILSKLLTDSGCSTVIAHSAEQATRHLETDQFHAMTLDVSLPGQDGISFLRQLRKQPKTQHLPVVIISAMADESKRELNGDAVGIIDWVQKPIDAEAFSNKLRITLSRIQNNKPRILHVEDDDSVVRFVSALVGDTAEIIAAATTAEAKRFLSEEYFDLVILDLILPDGDGEDLLPYLNGPERSSTPVIVFSSKEVSRKTADDIRAALVKSQTSNEELLRVIHSAIDKSMEAAE